jgi:hypothetical protein
LLARNHFEVGAQRLDTPVVALAERGLHLLEEVVLVALKASRRCRFAVNLIADFGLDRTLALDVRALAPRETPTCL